MSASGQIKPAGAVNHVGVQFISPIDDADVIEFYDSKEIGTTAVQIGEIDGPNDKWKFNEIAPLTTTLLCGGVDLATLGRWTSYTPTLSAGGSMTFTSTTITCAKYCVLGKLLYLNILISGTTGGTASSDLIFTIPSGLGLTLDTAGAGAFGRGVDGSAFICEFLPSSGTIVVRNLTASSWGLGSSRSYRGVFVMPLT